MKTAYDFLGIRSDADVEAVRKAFRAAVKLHHPDHHPGELDAPLRFRRVIAAYAVLRDPKRRAAYDRRLARERQRIRSERNHVIISGSIYGGVGMTLVIGFLSIARVYSTDKVDMETARGPIEIAAFQPAARGYVTGRGGLGDRLDVVAEKPGHAETATDVTGAQAISKHRPALAPLPNAFGDMPPNH
jgi:curved DNA-binding protein CbpA